MPCIKRGNEVCLCGNKAIKWKLHGWCCERCDKIERKNYVMPEDRKDKEPANTDYFTTSIKNNL